MDRVGVIGLGQMGLPIARNLMARGFRVTGYRRSGSPELVREGGTMAASPAEVAASSDVLLSIVPTAEDAEEIICGPEGTLSRLKRRHHPHRDEHHRRGPQGSSPRPGQGQGR